MPFDKKAYARAYYLKTRELQIERAKTWQKNNRARANATQNKRWPHKKFKAKHNTEKKAAALAGRPRPKTCEVCGRGGRICFDHCHVAGKFRGWICHKCNVICGFSDDSAQLLRKLAKYLEMHAP